MTQIDSRRQQALLPSRPIQTNPIQRHLERRAVRSSPATPYQSQEMITAFFVSAITSPPMLNLPFSPDIVRSIPTPMANFPPTHTVRSPHSSPPSIALPQSTTLTTPAQPHHSTPKVPDVSLQRPTSPVSSTTPETVHHSAVATPSPFHSPPHHPQSTTPYPIANAANTKPPAYVHHPTNPEPVDSNATAQTQ